MPQKKLLRCVEISGYSIMAIITAFQAEDRGSTPRTRSKINCVHLCKSMI